MVQCNMNSASQNRDADPASEGTPETGACGLNSQGILVNFPAGKTGAIGEW